MEHCKSQCLENPINKKKEREHEKVVDEAPPKEKKAEEYEFKDLYY